LKHANIIEEIVRLKNVPPNELTLDMVSEGISALQTAISLKKHRDIIDEYREVAGNKEKSISEVYDTLDGVKEALQKMDAALFNCINALFNHYGTMLAKLKISSEKLGALSRLSNLTGAEADIWRWIQLHYALSKKTVVNLFNKDDLDAFNKLRQKQVEHKNDLRMKNAILSITPLWKTANTATLI
jgi:hypothetical protein